MSRIKRAVRASDGKSIAELQSAFDAAISQVKVSSLYRQAGWVKSVRGAIITAAISNIKVGEICEIRHGTDVRLAEVVGFENDDAVLGPFGSVKGIYKRALVRPTGRDITVPVGNGLLGRVIDPLGHPIDGEGDLTDVTYQSVGGYKVGAMDRPLISETYQTGVKAIDAAILLGKGQRVGIFGSPGVGKSNLLAALASNGVADVIVIGLVGERAREVREFLDRLLPAEERQKIVCVVSTSESPAMERLYAAHTSNRIAEEFRDQGKDVLLLIDSLTRVARALREIGLSAGEAPTRRGYPASVYGALPEVIERAGRTKDGSVTALYTVLTEGEISEDPIAEEVRSLTDGHIILSRALAERGQYPAVDVLGSVSRLMSEIAEPRHKELAQKMRRLLSRYAEVEMLIQIGEYREGSDQELDLAVACYEDFQELLRQAPDEVGKLDEILDQIEAILNG